MNYRLTISPALELTSKTIVFPFETEEQMVVAKDAIADLLLFIQDDIKIMPDYSNVFLMEQLVDDEWEELDQSEWEWE